MPVCHGMGTPKTTAYITIKNIYGVEKYYPSCKITETFARIAGTKTLSKEVLKEITSLNYKVEVLTAPLRRDVIEA